MKQKKEEELNNSTNSSTSTRKRVPARNAGRFIGAEHLKEDHIIALGEQFVEWARESLNDPKSRRLLVEHFWLDRNILPENPLHWSKKYPEFKKLYEMGKSYLGIRRANGMILKELDYSSASRGMHAYLQSWRADDVYQDERAKVRKEDESKNMGNITVEIKQMPNSDVVPKKIDED